MERGLDPRWRHGDGSRCSAASLSAQLPVASDAVTAHYRRPGWFTRHVFNMLIAGAMRLGISVLGSRILRVRGRRTGQWRTVPVNVLTHESARYLVAPRGDTEWSRNLRAAGGGELQLGRRVEAFAATELHDVEKPAVLRGYLRRWKAEVGTFFDGVSDTSSDEELLRIASAHPVFRIEAR
jgi:deazaflavin-dependent oxidoreductase (nitroreductase family)